MKEIVTLSTHSISGLLVILLPSRQITQGAELAEASRTARAASAPIRQDYSEYKKRKLQSILSINRWKLRAKGRNVSQHCCGLERIVERIQSIRLCKPCIMCVRGPNDVGRAVQTDLTSWSYESMENHMWELRGEELYERGSSQLYTQL